MCIPVFYYKIRGVSIEEYSHNVNFRMLPFTITFILVFTQLRAL